MGAGQAPLVRWTEKADFPIVEMSRGQLPGDFPRVHVDGVAQGRMAAAYFAQRGFRNMVFVATEDAWIVSDRLEGFRAGAVEAGCRVEVLRYPDTRNPRRRRPGHLHAWLKQELRRFARPTAVLAESDDAAVYVLDACQSAGIDVPEDMVVAGFDNDEITCECAPVPLSSVDADLEALGYQSAALLDHLMAGGTPPDAPLRIPPRRFVVRQSTDLVAVAHAAMAKALHFIQTHYTRPGLQVQDVVAQTGLGRRGLNAAFSRHLGRTIGREIARCRLDAARLMLQTTNEPAQNIAAQCGYSGLKHLRRALKAETGLSPRKFRTERRGPAGPP
jgi:LacI family transcriptional regulator